MESALDESAHLTEFRNDSGGLTDEGDLAVAASVSSSVLSVSDTENPPKKRKKLAPVGMLKELKAEQKAVVKMNVTRDATTDGKVKCVYCDKEITSKNVDRWASHLRGCAKTPDEVKAQIQPFRAIGMPHPPLGFHTTTSSALPSAPSASATTATTHSMALAGPAFNETFKVHVAKDFMKFNAAHFIAYKVRHASMELPLYIA